MSGVSSIDPRRKLGAVMSLVKDRPLIAVPQFRVGVLIDGNSACVAEGWVHDRGGGISQVIDFGVRTYSRVRQ